LDDVVARVVGREVVPGVKVMCLECAIGIVNNLCVSTVDKYKGSAGCGYVYGLPEPVEDQYGLCKQAHVGVAGYLLTAICITSMLGCVLSQFCNVGCSG